MVRKIASAVLSLTCGVCGALLGGCGGGDHADYKNFSEIGKPAAETDLTKEPLADAPAVEPAAVEGDAIVSERTAGVDIEPASAAAPANVAGPALPAAPSALEPVNAEQLAMAALPVDPAAAAEPAVAEPNVVPRKVELLVKERDFQVEGPGGALRVSYDDLDLLKVLNMEPVTPDCVDLMPDWLRHLDGKRIRLRGFMYPTFVAEGIEHFVLARDNQICCFGRNPKIYDLVDVVLADGRTTKYIENRPFDVVGTFHIRLETSGDELFGLYWIDDAMVLD